jgi:PAS domain S-box-containing protein
VDRRDEAQKTVQAMLAGDADFCPAPLISRSGELISVETRVVSGQWNGKPVLFGVSVDITERKQAEDERNLRESYLSAIIENQSGLVWLKDAESRFLAVNKAFAISCGKQQANDLAGLTDLDIWPAELAEKYRKDDFSVMELRKPVMVEEQVYDQGVGKWFETYKTPVFDGQGAVIGTTGFARDITPRKQMEVALSRQTALLSNLLDSLPEIVFFKDLEGVYLGCNPFFEEFLGKSRKEIIGHTDYDLFPIEIAEFFRENDRITVAQNKARHNEEWITYPDGRRIPIDTLKAPLVSADGKVIGLLGVSRDISDRKQAEGALVQQSLLQKILMDIATTYINMPLAEVDQAIQTALKDLGEFVEADRAYIFDYDFSGGICTNTVEWCRDGISPQIEALQAVPLAELPDWVATHRRGNAVYYPDVAALPPGGARDILEPQQIRSLLTIPLTHEADCLGFVGFDSVRRQHIYSEKERTLLTLFAQMLTNIRLRRKNEAALVNATSRANDMADKAAAATIAKAMFLANMSHEIRTPLNAVLGHAQIMSRECRECQTAGESLPAIIRSGEHLLELISDILESIQADVQDIVLAASDFDFIYLLDSVRVMSAQKHHGEVPVEVVLAPDLPQFLYADKGKIRQVLLNLVGNAIKFTRQGRVCLSVGFCRTGTDNGFVLTVDVEDTGHGIEAGQLERIFDLFEQAESGQRIGKGTGLGLPLSRRYAQALGGNVIVLRSIPGAGSIFRFTFTARQGRSEKIENAKVVCRLAPGQPVPRILAVDDDLENLQMVQSMLEQAGFAIDVAERGASALDKFRRGNNFDLILMDKRMPGMDGLEVIKRLRELPGGRNIPIVFVTASALEEERSALLDAGGADGYLSKPLHREALLKEIQRLIGVHYEYDEPIVVPQRRKASICADDLLQIPAALVQSLRRAVQFGNIQQMQDVAADIAHDHPEVSAVLSDLISRYDYDELNRLLKQNQGES